MPIFFICMLIFVAWLWYERNKHTRLSAKNSQSFWEREEQANHTRNKDISKLPYLHMDLSKVPGQNHKDSAIEELYQKCVSLSRLPMLDLSGYSNTDLKLEYGVGNFRLLTNYDDNYTNFLLQLSILGRTFSEKNDISSAILCYEQVLANGSRKLQDFVSLGKLYLKLDQPEQLMQLITHIAEDESFERKEAVLSSLRQLLVTYQ